MSNDNLIPENTPIFLIKTKKDGKKINHTFRRKENKIICITDKNRPFDSLNESGTYYNDGPLNVWRSFTVKWDDGNYYYIDIFRKREKKENIHKKEKVDDILTIAFTNGESQVPKVLMYGSRVEGFHNKLKKNHKKSKEECEDCGSKHDIKFRHPDKRALSHANVLKSIPHILRIQGKEVNTFKFGNTEYYSFFSRDMCDLYQIILKDECRFLCEKCDKNF
jgi:DNA-directed RNA polymerase subunit RPC12/RpoP